MSSLHRCERGNAFVEAAITLPVLFILMIGVVDFGLAYSRLATVQKSLRNATRFIATLPSDALCGPKRWGIDQAKNLAVYGELTAMPKTLVGDLSVRDITVEIENCTDLPDLPLDVVRLKARVHYYGLIWQILGLPDSIITNATHEEKWIGA